MVESGAEQRRKDCVVQTGEVPALKINSMRSWKRVAQGSDRSRKQLGNSLEIRLAILPERALGLKQIGDRRLRCRWLLCST